MNKEKSGKKFKKRPGKAQIKKTLHLANLKMLNAQLHKENFSPCMKYFLKNLLTLLGGGWSSPGAGLSTFWIFPR